VSSSVEQAFPALPEAVRSLVGDSARLAVLRGLQLAELPTDDPDLDRLARLAAGLLDAPLALLTVVDAAEQHFKAAIGTELRGAPVELSFCAHALAGGPVTVVEDAMRDPRFAGNPFVVGAPFVRFYLGVPISVSGQKVGTLCVYDVRPRPPPSEAAVAQVQALAELAGSFLLLKDSSRAGMVARAALAREEKRRGIALEAASLASWVWNVDSHIVECDPLLPELFGMEPATRLHARRLFAAIDQRDLRASRGRFRQALKTDGEYLDEFRVAGSDPPRWLAARGRVVERDAAGRPTLLFGVNFDTTERRGTEERQRLLLRELNHRVKNTLATVQALASQTVRHAGNARDFLQAFSARLQALGAAHNLLSDRDWKGIGLCELVALETKPFQEDAAPRIAVEGADLMLPPDQAMGLGLILHELGSNALKHGALSQPEGRVAIAWRTDTRRDERVLMLDWRESGGPLVAPPRAHGFGTILIRRSLAKVLGSHVEHHFAPGGVEAEITVPLTEAEPLWQGAAGAAAG
jgi:two-component sensor histidine kinase